MKHFRHVLVVGVLHLLLQPACVQGSELAPVKLCDQQADDLFYQVLGIAAIDNSASQELCEIGYTCVDTLREWLKSPIHRIRELNPLFIQCGRHALEHSKNTNETSLSHISYTEDDLQRLKTWCTMLVNEYPHLLKKSLQHESTGRALLNHIAAQRIAQAQTNSPYMQGLLHAMSLDSTHNASQRTCEQIRRWIGSLLALKITQQTQVHCNQVFPGASPCQLHVKRSDAARLCNELMYESYTMAGNSCTAVCNAKTPYLPSVLQQAIESFLYDPQSIMRELHSVKNVTYDLQGRHQAFLVGEETFSQWTIKDKAICDHRFWGHHMSNTLELVSKQLALHFGKDLSHTVKNIMGSSTKFLAELELSDRSICLISNHYNHKLTYISSTHVILPSPKYLRYVASNCSQSLWYTDDGYLECSDKGSICFPTISLEVLATDDAGQRICGVARAQGLPREAPVTCLFSARYNAVSNDLVDQYFEDLHYALLNPVLALSHSGQWGTLMGQDAQSKTMKFALFHMNKALSKNNWHSLTSFPSGRIKTLLFSRDDTHLFCCVESEQKEKSAEHYEVLNLTKSDSGFTRCPMPRPKKGAGINAIDPYGEYIGVLHSNTNTTFCRIIPTDYFTKRLSLAFQQLPARDRLLLYLLHETIQRPLGYAHISPQQWVAFKRLGLKEHLFLRKVMNLTTTDGSRLAGYLNPSLKKKSLDGYPAVYAASNLSD